MVGFGQAVFDSMNETEPVQGMAAKTCDWSLAVLRQVGELDTAIGEHGIELEFKESIAAALGMSSGSRIAILPGQATAEGFIPLVHELAHEMLHKAERRTATTIFRSVAKNGTTHHSDMILKRHIRTALERIGVTKRIGFHYFRRGLAVMLRQHGVDLKTAQELLRHANS